MTDWRAVTKIDRELIQTSDYAVRIVAVKLLPNAVEIVADISGPREVGVQPWEERPRAWKVRDSNGHERECDETGGSWVDNRGRLSCVFRSVRHRAIDIFFVHPTGEEVRIASVRPR